MTKKDFITCGLAGWCLEVFWTGSISCLNNDPSMSATTSLLMFPIYSLGAFIKPISRFLSGTPVIFRGTVYTLCIYAVEYASGFVLKSIGICPWNYSHAKYTINGLVRLDYAPAWFTVGILFEKLLNPVESRCHTKKK